VTLPRYATLVWNHSRSSRGQQTYEQYSAVSLAISVNTPCNVLVFGCGSDSPLYYWANRMSGSFTQYIEDNMHWIKVVKEQFTNDKSLTREMLARIDIYNVKYTTKAEAFLDAFKQRAVCAFAAMDSVRTKYRSVFDYRLWTVILVDAPFGFIHGRSQSMYLAFLHTHRALQGGIPMVHVFVHDSQRTAEATYADAMFGTRYHLLNRFYEAEQRLLSGYMRYYMCDNDWASRHTTAHFTEIFKNSQYSNCSSITM